jgi:hypothetical protein
MLSLHRASTGNNFISENGLVAVLKDENQFVKGGTWKIKCPLSDEREHIDENEVMARSAPAIAKAA